jgi:hypothetical protein
VWGYYYPGCAFVYGFVSLFYFLPVRGGLPDGDVSCFPSLSFA